MTDCPVCGRVLKEPGYEFGELKHRCYTCTCGAHVILAGDAEKLQRELKDKSRKERPPITASKV